MPFLNIREQLNEVLIMKNTPNSGSWLDAKVSLPLQLPRDIQLEYHSPPNWKSVQSHRHNPTTPITFGYGEGPLQEEDANVLASRERNIVASRNASKAARKKAAEESLRVRLARLARERHAATKTEVPVLSAPGLADAALRKQSQAPHPSKAEPDLKAFRARSPRPEQGSGCRSDGQFSERGPQETAQRWEHLVQIEQMLQKHLQGIEASAAVSEKARQWLQGKKKELALTGAPSQSKSAQAAEETCRKNKDAVCREESGGERSAIGTELEGREESSLGTTVERLEEHDAGPSAQHEDPSSQSPLPRSRLPQPIAKCKTPPAAESQVRGGERSFEGNAEHSRSQDCAFSPVSLSGAFTSNDLRSFGVKEGSELGSLVNEVGSELGVFSLEQSAASDEEGWLIGSRSQPDTQERNVQTAEAEQPKQPVDDHRLALPRALGAEGLGGPGDDRSMTEVTSSGSSGVETEGPSHRSENPGFQDGPGLAQGFKERPKECDAGDVSEGAQSEAGHTERVRGGVWKREVFDEHGMGGQYFAAVWKSYSDWERQRGQGWARKQQLLEEQRKAQIEREKQLAREEVLAAQQRAAEEEERRLAQSRQTAEERKQARAEAERAERALRELENERLSSAMLARLSEKAAASGIHVPPLCGCGHATCPLDPRYTASCADNCEVRRSWDVYQKTLSDLLYAVGLL